MTHGNSKERVEWIDKWAEHDLQISPMAPSFCRRCDLSGADLNHYRCEPKVITNLK